MKKEPTRRQKWLPYVRSIADRLALRDWQLFVREGEPSKGGSAGIIVPYGRRIANLRLSDDFLEEDRAEQRHQIVHELIHAHLEQYVESVRAKSDDDPLLYRMMEDAVDGIADGVAPLLPLPPKL